MSRGPSSLTATIFSQANAPFRYVRTALTSVAYNGVLKKKCFKENTRAN